MRAAGYLLVTGGYLLWATNGIVSSLLLGPGIVGATDLAAVRIYGSAAILGLGVIAVLPRLSRSALIRLAVFGIFGVSLPQWLYYEAISRISVPIALVIVYTAPVLVTVFERVRRGVRITPAVVVAMVVAIGGVVLAVLGTDGGLGTLSAVGLLLAVATMVAYSGQILLAAVQPMELRPLQRIGGAMIFGSLVWLVVDPLWSIPWSVATEQAALGPRIDGTLPAGLLVLYITIFGTAVPYALLVAGTPTIGSSAAAVTGMIEPVAASILAWVLLGQSLTAVQVVGVAVALGGVTAAETLRSRARRRVPDAEEAFAA